MTVYYAIHNGPQGLGDGSDPANGMSLQGALTAAATAGDEVRVCATGAYSVSALTTPSAGTLAAPKLVNGATAAGVVDGTRPTVDRGGNYGFSSPHGYYVWRHIDFQGNTSNGRQLFFLTDSWVVENCSETSLGSGGGLASLNNRLLLRNFTASGGSGISMTSGYNSILFENVVISGAGTGFDSGTSNRRNFVMRNCVAYDCGVGFAMSNAADTQGFAMSNCLAYGCSTAGLTVATSTSDSTFLIVDSTFADCGDGIVLDAATTNRVILLQNCIMAFNSGYGINNASVFMDSPDYFIEGCAFYNNSSGNLALGTVPSSCSTTVDPQFVDRTNATLSLRNYRLDPASALKAKLYSGLGPNFSRMQDRGALNNLLTPSEIAASLWNRGGRTLTA